MWPPEHAARHTRRVMRKAVDLYFLIYVSPNRTEEIVMVIVNIDRDMMIMPLAIMISMGNMLAKSHWMSV